MLTITKTPVQTAIKSLELDQINYGELLQVYFLQAVIENLEDGILILNNVGELFHANASGSRMCAYLTSENNHQKFLHPVIWRLCQSLIENHSFSDEQLIILSDEIVVNQCDIFRIRVRLMNLNISQSPYFLVTIENRGESLKNVAIAEVRKYNLTPREAEIWSLYRSNYSYRDIANKLYITINTVKKHMKNIHAKRQASVETQHSY
ncbi:LuxR family transcriptional regulator [Calothrix sp. NIES-2100]|uniref:helix-turn-helix transcriptional regulator n=1 Tax=Calothrix sp. NIES-2100 TaxID=1954172 RepID=UPI000B5EF649|nr:LuxR family transcriptional regulator [Calothrix sp. NIES-2100]